MKGKIAEDAMVPIDCVYMLDINRHMDEETMTEVHVRHLFCLVLKYKDSQVFE